MDEVIIAASRDVATKCRWYYAEQQSTGPETILTWPEFLQTLAKGLAVTTPPLLSSVQTVFLVRQACLEAASQLTTYQSIAMTQGFWHGMARYIQNTDDHSPQDPELELIRQRYNQLVAASGYQDWNGRYQQITEAIAAVKPAQNRLLVVGLAEPNSSQQMLLAALQQQGLDWRRVPTVIPATEPGHLYLGTAVEPYGEVEAVAQKIKELLADGVDLADLTLLYPNTTYLNLIQKEFARQGLPLRTNTRLPLDRLPVVQQLLAAYTQRPGYKANPASQVTEFAELIQTAIPWTERVAELQPHSSELRRTVAARELRGVEALLDAAGEAAVTLELFSGTTAVTKAEFLAALNLAITTTTIREEPYSAPGIPCLPLTQGEGLTPQHLFGLGLTQQVLGRKPQGWLPQPGSQVEPTALLDILLAAGPATAWLSSPQADTKGARQLEPLYFTDLKERYSTRVEPLALPRHQPTVEQSRLAQLSIGAQDYQLDPEWTGTASVRSFAVSQLETYLNCPFSYYAQYVLKLPQPGGELPEVQVLDEGKVVHRILQQFCTQTIAPLDPHRQAEYQDLLTTLLDQNLAAQQVQLPDTPAGAWTISQVRIQGFLDKVLQTELRYYAQGNRFCPVYQEKNITPIQLGTAYGPVQLTGRIDRIDGDDQGNWLLIDYKGPKASRSEISKCQLLQLPIYAGAWYNQLQAEESPPQSIAVCYYSYRTGQRTEYVPVDLGPWLDQALHLAVSAVEGILAGDFPPQPVKPDRCERCVWSGFCRATGGLNEHTEVGEISAETVS